MLINRRERKRLHKRRVQLPEYFLVHQHGRRSIVLEKTNMAAVTSRENVFKRLYLSYRVHAFNPVIHVYV